MTTKADLIQTIITETGASRDTASRFAADIIGSQVTLDDVIKSAERHGIATTQNGILLDSIRKIDTEAGRVNA